MFGALLREEIAEEVVWVKEGVYEERVLISRSGTESAPIVFEGERESPDWTAVEQSVALSAVMKKAIEGHLPEESPADAIP